MDGRAAGCVLSLSLLAFTPSGRERDEKEILKIHADVYLLALFFSQPKASAVRRCRNSPTNISHGRTLTAASKDIFTLSEGPQFRIIEVPPAKPWLLHVGFLSAVEY